jgi:hypothetical protein
MSVLNVDTIANAAGSGPVALTKQHAAKNWCHYDGDASTPTILDSFNTASLSDTAAGRQSINLTNAHSSANYANFWSGEQESSGSGNSGFGDDMGVTKTSSKYNSLNQRSGGADFDLEIVSGSTMGDLA